MKKCTRNPFLLAVLAAIIGGPAVGQLVALTFTTLHHFSGVSDGAHSQAGLFLSGNTLYGTTTYGGGTSNGTVFAINIDGTGFTNVYSFTALDGPVPLGANNDGAQPYAPLILSTNTLYGTAAYGGIWGGGTLFTLNTDGTGFRTLYSFTGLSDGSQPFGGLVLSSNTLFGDDAGNSLFDVHTDGTGFSTLYSLTSVAYNPRSGLILSGNTLYGTTYNGGSSRSDFGTIFSLKVDGSGFTILHSFGGGKAGAYPRSGLVEVANTLYGTTYGGGSSGNGTVFKVNTDGTGFSILHSFAALDYNNGATNSDGANPVAGLVLSGSALYGTASAGGASGGGTIFALGTNGTSFTTLHSFTARVSAQYTNSDGAYPAGGLILSRNVLYGTTYYGGGSGNGTIFSISLASGTPQLTITPYSGNVILTWSTNATGFALQTTTNLASTVWTAVSSGPVVVNGQNAVTNLIAGTQQFYRLSLLP